MTDNQTSGDQKLISESIPDTHAGTVRKLADAMLRGSLWYGIAAAVAGTVVSALVVGLPGALGGVAGGALGVGSSVTTLVVMRKAAGVSPMTLLPVAMSTFIGKMIVLFVLASALRAVPMVHAKSAALTMLAVILVWTACEIRAFRKTKVPTIIVDSGPAASD
jgi:ATP synthase protein I